MTDDLLLQALAAVIRDFQQTRPDLRIRRARLSREVLGLDSSTISQWFAGRAYKHTQIISILVYLESRDPRLSAPLRKALECTSPFSKGSVISQEVWGFLLNDQPKDIYIAGEQSPSATDIHIHLQILARKRKIPLGVRGGTVTHRSGKAHARTKGISWSEIENILYTEDTVFVYLPGQHPELEDYVNHTPNLRYLTWWSEVEGSRVPCIWEPQTNNSLWATYCGIAPSKDWGLITVAWDRLRVGLVTVAISTLTKEGQEFFLQYFVNDEHASIILRVLHSLTLPGDCGGYQVLAELNLGQQHATFHDPFYLPSKRYLVDTLIRSRP